MLRASLIVLLVLAAACSQSSVPPTPTPTAETTIGAIVVGGDESSDLGSRAALIPSGSRTFKPGHRGVDALADMVARSDVLAVVDERAVAGELLEGATPRLEEQVPVARLLSAPIVVAVAPRSPIVDAAGLKKKLTEDASSLRFAGAEIGAIEHLVAALLVKDAENGAGALVFAAYGSAGDAANGVASGQSDVLVARYVDVKAMLVAGTLRALAITGETRVPAIDLPTLREAKIDVTLTDWSLLVAPASITAAHLAALRSLVDRRRATAQWSDAVRTKGWIDDATTQAMTTFLGTQLSRITSLYAELGLRR